MDGLGLGGLKIEKLGENNFHVWKQKVELVLAFRELDDHITEEDPPTDPDTLREWKKKDAKAKAVIGLTISDDHLDHVRDAGTAFEMWTAIVNIFQRRTLLNKLRARRNFYSVQMQDDERVLPYINRVRQLASDLRSMDVNVEDEDIAMSVLCGLPDRFEHLIVAIDTVTNDTDLTLDFVKSRLLQEEQRMNDRGNGAKKPDAALMTNNRNDRKCTYCKKKGHTEPFCWKKQRDEKAKKDSKPSGLITKRHQNIADDDSSDEEDNDPRDFVCIMANSLKQKINRASSEVWHIDSGATAHMTHNRNLFHTFESSDPFDVGMGSDTSVRAFGQGKIFINLLVNDEKKSCQLQNVSYVPDLRYNLISVSVMEEAGMRVVFENGRCEMSKGGKLIAEGYRHKGLYRLTTPHTLSAKIPASALITKTDDLRLWHARLAHVNVDGIKQMVSKKVVDGISVNVKQDVGICESCVYGKSTRAPMPKQGGDRSKDILDLVHSDIAGPIQVPSLGGSRYFITFTDDRSKYTCEYTMKKRSQALEYFKQWLAMAETQTGRKLKAFRSDNAGEYMSDEFEAFLISKGIRQNPTVPHNPHQNGVAERLNRTLVELVRSMLHHKSLPKHFWAEALAVAVYVRNRVTSRGLPGNTTPFEVWTGEKPNLAHLRVFGSKCWYTVPKQGRRKLDPRAKEAIFIGYSRGAKGYKLWNQKSQKVVLSRDVRFDEVEGIKNELVKDPTSDDDGIDLDISAEKSDTVPPTLQSVTEDDESDIDTTGAHVPGTGIETSGDNNGSSSTANPPNTEESQELRRSTRTRRPPGSWWKQSVLMSAAIPCDPVTYRQATLCPESDMWRKGMQSEYDSLMEHNTWVLEPRPSHHNVVSCKWVFQTKHEPTPDGRTSKRYKARLVARGFSQIEGVDYNETYAPVVKFTSVRILLATVTVLGLFLHQMDVKTAFLNGDLDETVYMEQPEGFKVKGKETWVCRLLKAIYGLKQASRQWYLKMDDFLTNHLHLSRNPADECLYSGCQNGSVLIIALYVDDLLIACSDMATLNTVKTELGKRFRMKDLQEARKCLGFEIERNLKAGTLRLTQFKYANAVLARFGMASAKAARTPMEVKLSLEMNSESAGDVPYREAIGSLMYLMVGTRPDIAFAVGRLAKYVENPTSLQWQAVKRLLRYVIGTVTHGISFQADYPLEPKGYVDADWAGDTATRKSMSGYMFVMAGGAISWCSRQQEVVALSSTEAEYISLCSGTKEAIWLRRLVVNLEIGSELGDKPMLVLVDNQGAIDLAQNGSTNRRTKHIDVRYHFNRQAVSDELVELKYCPTEHMAADILTKALGRVRLESLVTLFGMLPAQSQ